MVHMSRYVGREAKKTIMVRDGQIAADSGYPNRGESLRDPYTGDRMIDPIDDDDDNDLDTDVYGDPGA